MLSCFLVTACASQSALPPDIDAKLAQAGVEKQHEIFLADYRDHLLRASTVFANLARANAGTCERTGPLHTGLFVTTAAAFTMEQRFAARAGYNVENAADIIRRFAVLDPNAIHLSGGTHPSTALRFLAIEKTAEEIRSKQVAGAPVVPNAVNGARD